MKSDQKVIVSATTGRSLWFTVTCSKIRGGCGRWSDLAPETAAAATCPSCGAR